MAAKLGSSKPFLELLELFLLGMIPEWENLDRRCFFRFLWFVVLRKYTAMHLLGQGRSPQG
jgi:hypothetical protein